MTPTPAPPTDPAIARAVFVHRELAAIHARHLVARVRRELGLLEPRRRDDRGRFVKAGQ